MIDRAGRVDISFNAVGTPNAKILGVPMIELDAEQILPADHRVHNVILPDSTPGGPEDVANKAGVIMTVTAIPARTGTPLNGGYGPAHAAKEALTRDLSTELAPKAFA